MALRLSRRTVIVSLLAAAVVAPAPAMAATTVQSWASTGANPRGIAIDAQGNVFTANNGSNSVTRISANGLSAGTFGGTTGASPESIAIDAQGNVFTANSNGTVTRISASGSSTAQFGGSTGIFPKSIAIDAQGNVFTANYGGNSVTRISANGLSTAQFGGAITQPWGLALDRQGNVFTANFGGNSVTRISADGLSTTQFGSTVSGAPIGIAVDPQGNVFTANFLGDSVTRISANGLSTAQFGGTTGEEPQGVAFDPEGNVYTVNGASNTVTKIRPNGSTSQFGSTTGAYPYAIAVDGDGNVFTANTTSGTVTRISPDRGPLGFTTGDFPEVAVGSTAPLTVTATNSSAEGSVRPTAITVTGAGVAVTGGTCAVGTRIPPLSTCTVELTWAPTSAGPLSGGQLRIAYPEGSGSGEATVLTGTARAAAPVTPGAGGSVTPAAVLVATVVRSRPRVTSGRSLRVGIRARNTGSVAAASVTSCVTLPRNLIPTRTVGARRSGRTWCFAVGAIPAGQQTTRTITVRATSTRPITRYISGTARAPGLSTATAPRLVVRISPRAS